MSLHVANNCSVYTTFRPQRSSSGTKQFCTWWRPSRSKRRIYAAVICYVKANQRNSAIWSRSNEPPQYYEVYIQSCMLMQSCTCIPMHIYINLPVFLVVINLVSFFGSCPWHSTLTFTLYIVPGFSCVMLRWGSAGSTMLILAEAPSDCHCRHKSMYLRLVQQDSLWYQVKLIQVVPTVKFSITGGRGSSMYVHGKVVITRQCICTILVFHYHGNRQHASVTRGIYNYI